MEAARSAAFFMDGCVAVAGAVAVAEAVAAALALAEINPSTIQSIHALSPSTVSLSTTNPSRINPFIGFDLRST